MEKLNEKNEMIGVFTYVNVIREIFLSLIDFFDFFRVIK